LVTFAEDCTSCRLVQKEATLGSWIRFQRSSTDAEMTALSRTSVATGMVILIRLIAIKGSEGDWIGSREMKRWR
jgi:hypothetical protein